MPLNELVDELESGPDDRPGAAITFGLVDDPAAQDQYSATVDLAKSGGLVITGTAGSGKTTALVTMAAAAARDDAQVDGDRLVIFGIDAGSRELGVIQRLPQCAAVANADDLEAVTRVIGVLHDEMERRRSGAVVDWPTVLVLIDGFDGLTQQMEQTSAASGVAPYYAELLSVVADGRQLGIHTVLTATRRTALRHAVTAAITDRLTLRQAEAHDYTECGIRTADAGAIELPPGQGFLNGPTVVQVALADLPSQPCSRPASGLSSEPLSPIPPSLTTRALPARVPLLPSHCPLRPVIGLADHSLAPFALDLTHENVSVVGDPRSGRSTALAVIGIQAAKAGAEVTVIARPSSPLAVLADLDFSDGSISRCVDQGPDRTLFLAEFAATLNSPEPSVATKPQLLLLDDIDLLPDDDRDLVTVLDQLLGRVRFVAAGPVNRGYSHHPITQLLKRCRSTVYLRPHDGRDAAEVLGATVRWHPGLPMVEGRGYVLADRVATMVQFATGDRSPSPSTSPANSF